MTETVCVRPVLGGSRLLGAEIVSHSEPINPSMGTNVQRNKEENIINTKILNISPSPTPTVSDSEDETDSPPTPPTIDDEQNKTPTLPFSSFSRPMGPSRHQLQGGLALLRTKSCPELKYDECREFDSFSGEWVDSKGQNVLISPWGVIRYPNNPKLRFEATFLGENHLSVTFDKDPKHRKFVGKLNHHCSLLIWSNDTKWARKGSKHDPRFQNVKNKRKNSHGNHKSNSSCLVQ